VTSHRRGASDNDWHRPFVIITGAVTVVILLMLMLDMGPQTILIAAFGAFIGAGAWCIASLSHTSLLAKPPPRAVVLPLAAGADRRVRALRTGILFGRALDGHSNRLHKTLLELIDDQLIHAHGIDRAVDPDGAASIIGPKLTSFVNDPDAAASIAQTKELTRIVTLIEQI